MTAAELIAHLEAVSSDAEVVIAVGHYLGHVRSVSEKKSKTWGTEVWLMESGSSHGR